MASIDHEATPIDQEGERAALTLSVYPYEAGCDVPATTRVDVHVFPARGDGLGERVVVRSDEYRFEFRRTVDGYLEVIEPTNVALPEWVRTAILETDVGSVRE